MPSRQVSDLHPAMQDAVLPLLVAWKEANFDVLITCTLRSWDEQEALYDQGRKRPGEIVTNSRPGQSWHQYGTAIDVVPMVGGKALWAYVPGGIWDQMATIGKAHGLVWGGDFKMFKDRPHFELDMHQTLAEARAKWPKGYQPKGGA